MEDRSRNRPQPYDNPPQTHDPSLVDPQDRFGLGVLSFFMSLGWLSGGVYGKGNYSREHMGRVDARIERKLQKWIAHCGQAQERMKQTLEENRMKAMLDNLINGNLKEAKQQARRYTEAGIRHALTNFYGYSQAKAAFAARYLKTGRHWQDYCDCP